MQYCPDSRFATISSSTIDQSYSVDPATAPGGAGVQDKNPLAPNSGQTVGDCGVVWDSILGRWEESNSFTADESNFYQPTYSFSWTRAGTLTQSSESGELGASSFTQSTIGNFGSSVSAFPCTSNANIVVTDSKDGSTAPTSYTIRWHLPFEPSEKFDDDQHIKSILSNRVQNIYPGDIGIRLSAPPQTIEMSAVFEGLGAISASAGQEQLAGYLEIIAKAADITHWEYDFPGEPADQTGTGSIISGVAWQVAQGDQQEEYICTTANVPSNLASNPNGWQYCTLSINVVEKKHYSILVGKLL